MKQEFEKAQDDYEKLVKEREEKEKENSTPLSRRARERSRKS